MNHLFRLNVGCGQSPTPGWVDFDASPSLLLAKIPYSSLLLMWVQALLFSPEQLSFINFAERNHIRHENAVHRLPVSNNSCSVVYASHVLEHLYKTEARLFLKEAYRILAPRGIMRLAVPDLQIYIDSYQQNFDADQSLRNLYFFPSKRPGFLRHWVTVLTGNRTLHKWVYNSKSPSRFMLNSGFENPIHFSPGKTTIPDPGQLSLRELSWASLYIEAA